MKNLLKTLIIVFLGTLSLNAADYLTNPTIDIYGVDAKVDKDVTSASGAGIYLDSDELKVKLETTSDYVKTGAVYKFTPFSDVYFKMGVNYINQKMYAPDNTNARVNQFSGALAAGYMLKDDLYIELGGSYTKLNGETLGNTYEIVDENTKQVYTELAKRWILGEYGTLDTTFNIGKSYYEFKSNENSYGLGLDYYPNIDTKFSYNYQYEKASIVNVYKAQYEAYFIEYTDMISSNTYAVKAGVQFVVDDWSEFSSYKLASEVKPKHLSSLHKFENITFSNNMNIQSSQGVKKTDAALKREQEAAATPANAAPTWTASSYATGLTITDGSDTTQTIKDLTAVSSDADGDTMTYSIVSISVPGEQSIWNNSIVIESGILKVKNLMTNDPATSGTVTVTVRVTATGGSSDSTVSFTFNDVQ